jgi:hypothetical protein
MYECMNVNDIGGGMQLDLSCRVFLDNVAAESELLIGILVIRCIQTTTRR